MPEEILAQTQQFCQGLSPTPCQKRPRKAGRLAPPVGSSTELRGEEEDFRVGLEVGGGSIHKASVEEFGLSNEKSLGKI